MQTRGTSLPPRAALANSVGKKKSVWAVAWFYIESSFEPRRSLPKTPSHERPLHTSIREGVRCRASVGLCCMQY